MLHSWPVPMQLDQSSYLLCSFTNHSTHAASKMWTRMIFQLTIMHKRAPGWTPPSSRHGFMQSLCRGAEKHLERKVSPKEPFSSLIMLPPILMLNLYALVMEKYLVCTCPLTPHLESNQWIKVFWKISSIGTSVI